MKRSVLIFVVIAALVLVAGGLGFSVGSSRSDSVTNGTATPGTATPGTAAPTVAPTTAAPTTTVPEPTDVHQIMLTAGSDTNGHPGIYQVSASGEQLTVSAPLGQPNGNQRTAIVRDDAQSSVDQTQCISWEPATQMRVQPGVILRMRRLDGGAYSAISVTENVWGGATWDFKVLEWNGQGSEPGLSMFHSLAGFTMFDAVGSAWAPDGMETDQWNLCANATGPVLQVKVWTGDGPEPSWDDQNHVASTALPETVLEPGVPGVYVGHLSPGDIIHFPRTWNPTT